MNIQNTAHSTPDSTRAIAMFTGQVRSNNADHNVTPRLPRASTTAGRFDIDSFATRRLRDMADKVGGRKGKHISYSCHTSIKMHQANHTCCHLSQQQPTVFY